MVTSPMVPSTPRLSEVARHVVIPSGIVSTAWPRVVAKCAELGVTFDPWQHGIGSIALGKRKDGKYAATVGGVVLSIPRQVGKTFLVGMIVIALCTLFPGMTVLWTAHRTRTATKTFHTLKAMTERKKIKPLMLDPRLSNGEQELRFRNGSVIMFGAREQGFGRGFDEVDIEVFDEAQILSEKALEDMVPAANQSRHPAGALLFFMGTPPRPSDPGEEFTNRRKAAISGKSEDMAYVEFSADPDADPDDRAQWSKANPSFPLRTPVESVQRMRANLTDLDSFMREGLGVWDDGGNAREIPGPAWREIGSRAAVPSDPLTLVLDVAPEAARASLVVCGLDAATGKPVVEVVDNHPGTEWVVERVRALKAAHHIKTVGLDKGGPAGDLIVALEAAGVVLTKVTPEVARQATGAFMAAVHAGSFLHRDDPVLNEAAAGARRRKVGDGAKWSRTDSTIDISPIVAATLALHLSMSSEQPVVNSVW